MGQFVRGDVVVLPFPFSDLSGTKRRPALVLADLTGDDVILCQITSQQLRDNYAVPIDTGDFISGALQQPSNIRPNRLFTGDSNIVAYKIGTLNDQKVREVLNVIINLLS